MANQPQATIVNMSILHRFRDDLLQDAYAFCPVSIFVGVKYLGLYQLTRVRIA